MLDTDSKPIPKHVRHRSQTHSHEELVDTDILVEIKVSMYHSFLGLDTQPTSLGAFQL